MLIVLLGRSIKFRFELLLQLFSIAIRTVIFGCEGKDSIRHMRIFFLESLNLLSKLVNILCEIQVCLRQIVVFFEQLSVRHI
jgi:hypothetical protein